MRWKFWFISTLNILYSLLQSIKTSLYFFHMSCNTCCSLTSSTSYNFKNWRLGTLLWSNNFNYIYFSVVYFLALSIFLIFFAKKKNTISINKYILSKSYLFRQLDIQSFYLFFIHRIFYLLGINIFYILTSRVNSDGVNCC